MDDAETKAAQESVKNRNAILDISLKHGGTILLGLASIAVTIWGAKKSWVYEEDDSYTKAVDKAFISRLFKSKWMNDSKWKVWRNLSLLFLLILHMCEIQE